jgi:hypothetical protein
MKKPNSAFWRGMGAFFAAPLVDAIRAKNDPEKWGEAVQWGFMLAGLWAPGSITPTLQNIQATIAKFWGPVSESLWPPKP